MVDLYLELRSIPAFRCCILNTSEATFGSRFEHGTFFCNYSFTKCFSRVEVMEALRFLCMYCFHKWAMQCLMNFVVVGTWYNFYPSNFNVWNIVYMVSLLLQICTSNECLLNILNRIAGFDLSFLCLNQSEACNFGC
ncbi:hypothetical protein Dimus_012643 [Dionaea muscipula]